MADDPKTPETREERREIIQENLRKPQVHHPSCCCGGCKQQAT